MTDRIEVSEKFHGVDAVAEALDVTPTTIRRLIARGELQAVRVGRVLRVSQSSFNAFVKRGRGAPKPASESVPEIDWSPVFPREVEA
jgi:excisionase family DNA binding protein